MQFTVLLVVALTLLSLLECARSDTVQLSFCLIVGTATTGQQTAQTFTSVATGIFNTTTPAGSLAYGQAATFTISSLLQGSIYTSASLQPTNLTLASVYSLPSTQVCCYSTPPTMTTCSL